MTQASSSTAAAGGEGGWKLWLDEWDEQGITGPTASPWLVLPGWDSRQFAVIVKPDGAMPGVASVVAVLPKSDPQWRENAARILAAFRGDETPKEAGPFPRPTGPGRWWCVDAKGRDTAWNLEQTADGLRCVDTKGSPFDFLDAGDRWYRCTVHGLDSPSPSSSPPVTEEWIKEAAEKAAAVVFTFDGEKATSLSPKLDYSVILGGISEREVANRIASALRSCPQGEGRREEGDSIAALRMSVSSLRRRAETLASERDAALSKLAEAEAFADDLVRNIERLTAESAASREERAKLRDDWIRADHEIEQILGKALGYPVMGPEVGGDGVQVCVGDHVPATLAEEVVEKLSAAREAQAVAERERDEARQKANELYAESHELDSAHEKLNRNGIGGGDDPLWQRLDILLDRAALRSASPPGLPPLPEGRDWNYFANVVNTPARLKGMTLSEISWVCDCCRDLLTARSPSLSPSPPSNPGDELEGDKETVRAPVGIMPRWRHAELRCREIYEAAGRFTRAGIEVPREWWAEAGELCLWMGGNHPSSLREIGDWAAASAGAGQ